MQRTLEAAGWSKTTRWDWDLYWRPQVPSLAAYASLRPGMRVNHIPGIGALTSPRRLRSTLAEAGADDLLASDDDDDSAEAESFSRFVLVSGVDPLRIYVHARDDSAVDEAEVHRVIRRAIFAGRDAMTRAVRDLVADRDGCFELLRFDFLRGRKSDGRVLLVRCVLSPPLDDARVVVDTLALLGILPARARSSDDLEERWWDVASDEMKHLGGYRRIVPSADPAAITAELALPRRSDLALVERLGTSVVFDPRFLLEASSAFLGGKLVLFAPAHARFYMPNDTAAYVWLRLEDRASLDAIASELHVQFTVPLARARCDVWDIVARWVHDGLVRREDRSPAPRSARDADRATDEGAIEITGTSEEGFRVTAPWGDRGECRTEAELAPLVRRFLALDARRRATGVVAITGVAVLPRRDAASVPCPSSDGARSVIVAGPEALGGGGLAALLLARGYPVAASAMVLVDESSGAPLPLPLALEVSELDQRDAAVANPELDGLASWTLPVEIEAKYLPFEVPSGPFPPVGAIVFVRRATPGTHAALAAVDCSSALHELARQGFGGSPAMTGASATRFLAWLERTPCFEIAIGDLVSAADAVEALLRGGPR